MHPLDNFENFLSNWIDELHEPDDKNKGGYTGSKCPFAKKAKVKTVKVYDYINPYSYWSVVVRECSLFDPKENDIVIVAASSNSNIINPLQMEGAVASLNASLNYDKKDVWVIDEIGPYFTIILINPLSSLDDASKVLEEKGYYNGRLSQYKLDMLVYLRRRMRELL